VHRSAVLSAVDLLSGAVEIHMRGTGLGLRTVPATAAKSEMASRPTHRGCRASSVTQTAAHRSRQNNVPTKYDPNGDGGPLLGCGQLSPVIRAEIKIGVPAVLRS
jgi:hypothetical protein